MILDQHLSYWKQQLAGAPELLTLPTDRARPALQSFRGGSLSRLLPQGLIDRLTVVSQSEGATLFMTLLAGFQILLSRYAGQEDIVVGSPIANRNHTEIEPLIGFFVNTLALRTDLSGDPRFIDLLARVKESTLQAYAHQDIPFEKLVEELQPERSLSHHPIFQVMFALQNVPLSLPALRGLQLERLPLYTGTSMFDMSWFAIEVAGGLQIRCEYSSDLFDESSIARALEHFENLLGGIAEAPAQTLSQLPLLGREELDRLLIEFNASERRYTPDCCIQSLLEARADSHPQATALVFEAERISYRELNERANRIAHHLIERGSGPGTLVAIYSERTAEMVAGILGILKSGAAYVPLDPKYPAQRLRAILEDAATPIVLTQHSLLSELPALGATLICLDTDRAAIDAHSSANPGTRVRPEDLAFVLFTSGSTGRPKGVALEHRNAVNFVRWVNELLTPQELAGVLFCTSICFDMSTFEMFVTLGAGGKMILVQSPMDLAGLGSRDEVTLVNTVPSALQELLRLKALPASLKTVVLAGEALPQTLAEEIHAAGVKRLFNMYGPTETGYTTSTLVAPHSPISIGKPIANAQAYVLDSHRRPQPIGVPGEIHLAGAGMARGYYGRLDLTAERFIPNPFLSGPSARMYRTGDLGRWLADGNLQYLGRIDHQVKLRGFRIELGEIEAALAAHPDVEQAVVLAREDRPGIKLLVGYVVPAASRRPTSEQLRAHLQTMLPEFMLPSALLLLDSFPLTPNGKVDRKALPAPESAASELHASYLAPRDAIERKLVRIWEQALGIRPIGIATSFFELGGSSLLAARIFVSISRAFGKDLPLVTLLRSPTVEQLATHLRPDSRTVGYDTLAQIQPKGSAVPFFCVHGGAGSTLFLHRLARAMGNDQPLYGFEPEGLDGGRFQRTSVQAMAAHYIAEIRKVQPTGPYCIGGYCFGGLVAHEMAQQLRAQGERTPLVALFSAQLRYHRAVPAPRFNSDTPASPRGRKEKLLRLLRSPARTVTWRMRRLGFAARSKLHAAACKILLSLGLKVPQAMRTLYVARTLGAVEKAYKPQPFAGKLVLFCGGGEREQDPEMGWGGLAQQVEVCEIGSGGRNERREIMNEPLVRQLAQQLLQRLHAATKAPSTRRAPDTTPA